MGKVIQLNMQEDILHYETVLNNYNAGQVNSDCFTGERLLMGIYAQRQEERFMVRTKLPGGRLRPEQLSGIAEALELYSSGDSAHITTRQDFQIYDVKLADTPDLLRHLARYGITTREASGNTVRNITSCPLAGVCPHEHVDVGTHVQQASRYFLRHPLTQLLPRKFKISFSACEADCAQGLIHDMAFIATHSEGRPGFMVLVGGGLGAKPHEALLLEPFIDEQMLLPVIEAVLTLHNKYSDHQRKNRSRLKFLVASLGIDVFLSRYQDELSRTLTAFDENKAPRGQWRQADAVLVNPPGKLRAPIPQHQAGYYAVPISIPSGQIKVDQLHGLARLFEREDFHEVRATQNQNLVVHHVAEKQINTLRQGLHELGLGLPRENDNVVTCPGTDTCPLGITASQLVARELNSGPANLRIRVNGCHNNCANANTADIGLYGKGRRHYGNMVPSYTVLLGGNGALGGALAFAGPDIPAVRVPMAVKRIQDAYLEQRAEGENFTDWSRRKGAGYFKTLLHDLAEVKESEVASLIRDHGDARVFKVKSTGIGECAGVRADPVSKLLLDVAYEAGLFKAFAAKHKFAEAGESLDNALLLMSKAMLLQLGQASDDLDTAAMTGLLRDTMLEEASLWDSLESLQSAVSDFCNNPDELVYPELSLQVEQWLDHSQAKIRRLQTAAMRPGRVATLPHTSF